MIIYINNLLYAYIAFTDYILADFFCSLKHKLLDASNSLYNILNGIFETELNKIIFIQFSGVGMLLQ